MRQRFQPKPPTPTAQGLNRDQAWTTRFNTSRPTKSIVSRLNQREGNFFFDFFLMLEKKKKQKEENLFLFFFLANFVFRSSLSSMDSDLEAFSHNPTDDSFSPLIFQSSENTNYLNQRFLSYWVELLSQRPTLIVSISRVKLTCLTTV